MRGLKRNPPKAEERIFRGNRYVSIGAAPSEIYPSHIFALNLDKMTIECFHLGFWDEQEKNRGKYN
jgi:hypothetical protein